MEEQESFDPAQDKQQNEVQEEPFDKAPLHEGRGSREQDKQQNVQMEPTPVSEPPSHKKMIIGIVVGFVLAVAGVVGALLVLNSEKSVIKEEMQEVPQETQETTGQESEEETPVSVQDELPLQETTTSGTQLYRNEEWGFEFEYPEDWTLHVISDPFRGIHSKFQIMGASPEESGRPNTLFPSLLVNVVTPEFVERQFSDLNDIALETVVGGVRGFKYEYKEQAWHITIILPLGEYRMILGVNKGYEDVLNQILSTFNFFE